MSREGRDIGPIPPVANPERRARAEQSLEAFLLEYFAGRFPLPFSADHRKAIGKIRTAVVEGGNFALAMQRGSGKTTIAEGATIEAIVNGRREYPVLIGATQGAAEEMLASIKIELETNDRLAEDYPEVCFPIRALEGQTQRCRGQLCQGRPTRILWKQKKIALPSIPGSRAAEVCLQVAGITGRIRGMKHTRTDGRIVRPDVVIIDDPQTDDSADSPLQVKKRLKTMNAAILKLGGPDKNIAAVCPCTVICKGDLADQLLDRDLNPHWNGERCKALYAFPTRMDRWQRYYAARSEELRAGGDGSRARTEVYAANREAMDAGADVAWPERKRPEDLSALETLMRLYFEDVESFLAECQNEPRDSQRAEGELTAAEIRGRYLGRARGVVPQWGGKLTSFVDVQGSLLYWMVCAWQPETFTGTVVDYGTYPEQPGRKYFTLADAHHTLQLAEPKAGLEAQIRAGLAKLVGDLAGREWSREDGTVHRLDRILVDAGYQTDTVYEYCRSSFGRAMPSHGRPIGAGSTPMHEIRAKAGEELGYHWFITAAASKRAIRHVLTDTYHWKGFLVARLRTPIGDPGALTLFGSTRQDGDHEMLADHLCSEKPVEVTKKGRTVVEWEHRPGRPDNHLLDCLVGCYVGASMEKVQLPGQAATGRRPRQSLAQKQREKRHGRR